MMDYNYYPAQTGQLPPPPSTTMITNNNQHDCTMLAAGQMTPTGPLHSSPAPSTPQSMRHTPGPHPMQPHHVGPHHPMTPQQQSSPHPNYHPLPSHPPVSLSASPHPSSTPHSQAQPPPRPSTGSSPHHHHQSPIHMNGPSPKNPPHGHMPMQSRPPSNQLPPHGHNFTGSPMPPNGGGIPYGQPSHSPQMNQHHLPPPPPPQHPMNHGGPPMMQPSGPIMTGGPPPHAQHHPPSGYMPPHPGVHHPGPERSSPFYHHQHIPPSEFRIIELNKRLQSRPRNRMHSTPLPIQGSSDESNWWERFACDFFDDEATLSIRTVGEAKPIEYTIGRPLIPRFFKSYFDGGVTDLSIKLRNNREMQHPHPPGLITLECEQADIVTKNVCRHPTNTIMYVVVHTEGYLSLEFVCNSFDNLVIRSWRFQASQCNEYVDRSTTTQIPSTFFLEPVTRFGLTKSTVAYLKMCMIMEPMKDLMIHYRQTNGNVEPRMCLKHLLVERYKFKDIDDNRAQPNKRRKRKAPATSAATNKKSKANANVMNGVTDVCMGIPNMPLASQDVLTVGEPSMLGEDFGDENERRITRLENNQYDSTIDQKCQQSNIASDSNEMNQGHNRISTNNMMNQNLNPQNSLPNHLTQVTNNHATGSNGNQSTLPCYKNINHNNGGVSEHGNSNSSGNELHENNLNPSGTINNNGTSNCIQDNNSTLDAGDTANHQMNYSMNGETVHIKNELDSQQQPQQQQKQSMQPPPNQQNSIAESDSR